MAGMLDNVQGRGLPRAGPRTWDAQVVLGTRLRREAEERLRGTRARGVRRGHPQRAALLAGEVLWRAGQELRGKAADHWRRAGTASAGVHCDNGRGGQGGPHPTAAVSRAPRGP